jgi:hypothetical protein
MLLAESLPATRFIKALMLEKLKCVSIMFQMLLLDYFRVIQLKVIALFI